MAPLLAVALVVGPVVAIALIIAATAPLPPARLAAPPPARRDPPPATVTVRLLLDATGEVYREWAIARTPEDEGQAAEALDELDEAISELFWGGG